MNSMCKWTRANRKLINLIFGALTILIVSVIAGCAQTNQSASNQDAQTNQPADHHELHQRAAMQFIANDMIALREYLESEEAFTAQSNSQKIQHYLDKLDNHISSIRKQKTFNRDLSTKTNFRMLERHIGETKVYFRKPGTKKFARYMLQSSLGLCANCHTRFSRNYEINYLPRNQADQKGVRPFDQAQFFFALRTYSEAKKEFIDIIRGFPGNNSSIFEVTESMKNLIYYHVRVSRNPDAALSDFRSILKSNNLPTYLRRRIGHWINGIREWKKNPDRKLRSTRSAISQARSLLNFDDGTITVYDQNYVRALRASNILHLALDKTKPNYQHAEVLHLLGLLYHDLEATLFFNYDEAYLETCVTEFPHSKQAVNCFNSLQEIVYEGFTGSSGTFVPDDVQAKLSALKKVAY